MIAFNTVLNLAPFARWTQSTCIRLSRLALCWPRKPRLTFLLFGLVAMCISLVGCCAFAPCHPATSLVGTVRDVNGLPVAHANITLYGTTSTTDSKGCFKMHMVDALPFTFSVTAKVYKSAESEAKAGFYRVNAQLAHTTSLDQSRIERTSISQIEYRSITPCEH